MTEAANSSEYENAALGKVGMEVVILDHISPTWSTSFLFGLFSLRAEGVSRWPRFPGARYVWLEGGLAG